MQTRKDEKADSAILKAASKLFAAKGFRAATVREICGAAGANIALVSRYFGSKAELYAKVCRSLFDGIAAPLAKLDVDVDCARRWQGAVREWIERVLSITSAVKSPEREIAGIFKHEMTSPSPMHDYLRREFMKPVFDCFRHLVEMGGSRTEETTLRYMTSVWAQVSIYALLDERWQKPFRPAGIPRPQWIAQIADALCGDLFSTLHFKGN